MKFLLTYTLKQNTRDAAFARFLKTGALAPKGSTLLGRWTRADLSGGFLLCESSEVKPLAAFSNEWSDVVDLMLTPVLEDAELAEVLQGAKKRK
jgi:hypothetical protein